MQHILMGTTINVYKQFLAGFKESAKGLALDQWELGSMEDVNMKQFWTWSKFEAIEGSGYI